MTDGEECPASISAMCPCARWNPSTAKTTHELLIEARLMVDKIKQECDSRSMFLHHWTQAVTYSCATSLGRPTGDSFDFCKKGIVERGEQFADMYSASRKQSLSMESDSYTMA